MNADINPEELYYGEGGTRPWYLILIYSVFEFAESLNFILGDYDEVQRPQNHAWLPPTIRACDPEIIRALQDFVRNENIRL